MSEVEGKGVLYKLLLPYLTYYCHPVNKASQNDVRKPSHKQLFELLSHMCICFGWTLLIAYDAIFGPIVKVMYLLKSFNNTYK